MVRVILSFFAGQHEELEEEDLDSRPCAVQTSQKRLPHCWPSPRKERLWEAAIPIICQTQVKRPLTRTQHTKIFAVKIVAVEFCSIFSRRAEMQRLTNFWWTTLWCRPTTWICTAKCRPIHYKNALLFRHSNNNQPNNSNNWTIARKESTTAGPTPHPDRDRKMVSWTNIDDQLQCLVEYYEHFPHSHHSRALIF